MFLSYTHTHTHMDTQMQTHTLESTSKTHLILNPIQSSLLNLGLREENSRNIQHLPEKSQNHIYPEHPSLSSAQLFSPKKNGRRGKGGCWGLISKNPNVLKVSPIFSFNSGIACILNPDYEYQFLHETENTPHLIAMFHLIPSSCKAMYMAVLPGLGPYRLNALLLPSYTDSKNNAQGS